MARIDGLDELSKKLARLGSDLGIKTMRKATRKAIQPVFSEIKAAAPVGREPHKTYRGRTVSGGFLSRNIKLGSKTIKREGKAQAIIRVHPEAFYGVQFLDAGVPSRGIPAKRWFADRFYKNRRAMENSLVQQLKRMVDKI